MNHIPLVKSVMTLFPFWIGVDAPIEHAQTLMEEKNIRHIPVKESGHLIGMLSHRDMLAAIAAGKTGSGPGQSLTVGDVCVRKPYIVDLNEPLDNVLLAMAREHIGSIMVTKEGRLAGVFTTNDACRVFAEFLREKYRPNGGNDAA